ncbi:MAG: hypothetical protein QOD77_1627 [Thermoplasmata archaeon]|jgi:hypothetical protein|nr:hypothetical protein [Thermoplasmata archaeon]
MQHGNPWRVFVAALVAAFVLCLLFMATALYWRLHDGAVTEAQFSTLLALLRNLTYPLAFVALGALLVHYVKLERGDYARR